ncbi:hypothetical protein Rs2_14445 [Raphanus sativus]|nr:hypothetical protein Rs2_14445 [Raphanus sativus]
MGHSPIHKNLNFTDISGSPTTCRNPHPFERTCLSIPPNRRSPQLHVFSGDHDRDSPVAANPRSQAILRPPASFIGIHPSSRTASTQPTSTLTPLPNAGEHPSSTRELLQNRSRNPQTSHQRERYRSIRSLFLHTQPKTACFPLDRKDQQRRTRADRLPGDRRDDGS